MAMHAGPGRRRLLVGAAGYVALLAISLAVRVSHRADSTPQKTAQIARVNIVGGHATNLGRIEMAYLDFRQTNDASAPVVVLLHGSPGRKEDFARLGPILAARYRVIVPDLPGFGESEHRLPDYSFRAQADYVRQLLQQLRVDRAHVVAYSMGGGAALNFTDAWPQHVASLTLLSAIGVQELELTGDYYLNHAVHGVQLAALWLLTEGTPHLGLLDSAMLNVPYARSFFDSDQRPLRHALRRLRVPVLILHGAKDGQVPIEAAEEHARLVPQSELVVLDNGHLMPFTEAPLLAAHIAGFIDRVQRGGAKARDEAGAERREASLPLYPARPLPQTRGIAAAVLGLILAGVSTASASAGAAAAGLLVTQHRLSPIFAWAGCFSGVSLATAYGALRRRRPAWAGLAPAALWTVASIAVSALVTAALLSVAPRESPGSYLSSFVSIAASVLVLGLVWSAPTHRRRRLLLSSWRRLTRWEFWPAWVFYPPLFAYLVYLMTRHRGATVFTAANPAIVGGGFVGESKFDILTALRGAGQFVARAQLINGDVDLEGKVGQALAFMNRESLSFPVVLKPNQGQRGSGVVVVRSEAQLTDRLRHSSVDTIIQEYVPGLEFGVFYYRYPTESSGRILSVTEKRFPTIVGDGCRTFEQLILDDDRAVCAARLYCDLHRQRLRDVPAAGESIALVELGTHCRGAMFLDGAAILTPALAARFDQIARAYDGFYFGRFDVRAYNGIDEFRSGKGFKVIELNGVTSEATHIYQPGTPLRAAYRVLMDQWRIAFEIGAQNRQRGMVPASIGTLLKLAGNYRRTAQGHLR